MLPEPCQTIAQARRHGVRPGAEVCLVTLPMRSVIPTGRVWLIGWTPLQGTRPARPRWRRWAPRRCHPSASHTRWCHRPGTWRCSATRRRAAGRCATGRGTSRAP